MLSVANLNVRLGQKHILHNISFLAEPGEILAIVGPNGSGKSTLLKALVGEIPFWGSASLNHLDIARTSPFVRSDRAASTQSHRPCASLLPAHA